MREFVSFDPLEYKRLYGDLRNLSDEELYKHYTTFGIKEHRIYKEFTFESPVSNRINVFSRNCDTFKSLFSPPIHFMTADDFESLDEKEKVIYIDNELGFDLTQDKLERLAEYFSTSFADFLSPLVVSRENKLVYYGSFVKDSILEFVDERFIALKHVKKCMIQNTFLFFPHLFVSRKHFLKRYLDTNYDHLGDESIVFKVSTFDEFCINNQNTIGSFRLDINTFHRFELKEHIDFVKQYLSQTHIENINYSIRMQRYKYLDFNDNPYVCILTDQIITPDQDFKSLLVYQILQNLIESKHNIHYYVLGDKRNWTYSTFLLKMGIKIFYLPCDQLQSVLEKHDNLYKFVLHVTSPLNMDILQTATNTCTASKHVLFSKKSNLTKEMVQAADLALVLGKTEFDYFSETDITREKVYFYPTINFSRPKNIENRGPITQTSDMYFIASLKDENLLPLTFFLENFFSDMISVQPLKFYIVGSICGKLSHYSTLYPDNLILCHHLHEGDLERLLSRIRIHFVPNFLGHGMRGKILQSLSLGIPTIVTNLDGDLDAKTYGLDILHCPLDADNKNMTVSKFFDYYNNIKLLQNVSCNALANVRKQHRQSICNVLYSSGIFLKKKSSPIPLFQIAVVFQIYHSTIYDLINYCNYFQSKTSFRFVVIFVNNNTSIDLEPGISTTFAHSNCSNLDIRIIQGDNSYFEFSGYQKGLDYIRDNGIECQAVLIVNETVNERVPIYLHQIKNTSFQLACTDAVSVGHIDKNPKTIVLQGENINNWIRSNFILVNVGVLRQLNYRILRLKDFSEITLDPDTNRTIDNRLSLPYYRKYSGETLKMKKLMILNEFYFSFHLSLYSRMVDFLNI